jgi:hypothetical protein
MRMPAGPITSVRAVTTIIKLVLRLAPDSIPTRDRNSVGSGSGAKPCWFAGAAPAQPAGRSAPRKSFYTSKPVRECNSP